MKRSPSGPPLLHWLMSLAVLAGGVSLSAWADDPRLHRTYDAKRHRDPFVPLVRDGQLLGAWSEAAAPAAASFASLELAGILWDPAGRSVALVNGAEVKVGDLVGVYRVVEIRPDAVVLDDDGQQIVLQMGYGESGTGRSPSDVPPTGGDGRGD